VLVEAPGSQSFEMSDIPAIAAVAHAKGALVIDDNTWAPRPPGVLTCSIGPCGRSPSPAVATGFLRMRC
jgi:hypothetical protein